MSTRALTSRSAEGLVARTWGSAKLVLRCSAQTECGAASLPDFRAIRLWSDIDRGLSRRVVELAMVPRCLRADHDQQHLEFTESLQSVGLICWQENRFACRRPEWLARNRNFRFPLQQMC